MKRLLAVVVFGVAIGCGGSKPDDPHIKAERAIVHPGGGARVGPVGGDYQHGAKIESYDGPASKAPAWAK
jgi:hypothetical protein